MPAGQATRRGKPKLPRRPKVKAGVTIHVQTKHVLQAIKEQQERAQKTGSSETPFADLNVGKLFAPHGYVSGTYLKGTVLREVADSRRAGAGSGRHLKDSCAGWAG